jgi:hypothetical protein
VAKVPCTLCRHMTFLLETRGNGQCYVSTKCTFDRCHVFLIEVLCVYKVYMRPLPRVSNRNVVLRGHLWDKQKVAYKTGELLKEVKFI